MGARLLARAGSDVGEGDGQHAANLDSARLSDLYATAIRESAGRLGCVWVVGREKTRNLPGSIDGIPPLLPPAHEGAETLPTLPPPRRSREDAEAETIPVDVDLKEMSSGPRPIITSRHRRETRSRINQAQMEALQPPPSEPPPSLLQPSFPPPPPLVQPRSLLAQVATRPRPTKPGGILQMMAITACTTFLLIVIALFVAEYRGMPVHAMIETTGHAIAHAIRQLLASVI